MTGKTNRKPTPYQLYQAYSVNYYQQAGSELHKQVKDLWDKHKEQPTIDLLSPYGWDGGPEKWLIFHGAAMRWKCLLLADKECQELQEWIDKKALEEEEGKQLWKVVQGEGEDGLSTRDKYLKVHTVLISLNYVNADEIPQLHWKSNHIPIPTLTPAADTIPLLLTPTTSTTPPPPTPAAGTTTPLPTPTSNTTAVASAGATPPKDAGFQEPPFPHLHLPEPENAEPAPSTVDPNCLRHNSLPAGTLTSYLRLEKAPNTNTVRISHVLVCLSY